MPDYALCDNEKCKKHKECCRFLGKPGQWRQSYIITETVEPCELFWPLSNTPPFELRKLEEGSDELG